ncbi:MAG TPA: HI0074 family nucleotidyltransferase substrate-binding subunit [Candidatus Saccharimonadales bacterium]|jgi:nucleotidyltransferase substrate binding protein (TIGR01987 family)
MNDKLEAQKGQLKKAKGFLDRALKQPENEFQRAAVIQAFEFCFELSWKYLKTLVEDDGSMIASPKAVIREAARHGFIDNPEDWFGFLQSRNLTTHTYIEAVAEKVYATVKDEFAAALEKLIVSND